MTKNAEQGKEVALSMEQELAQFAAAQAQTERPPLSMIGTKAGIMTYMGDPVPNNNLDCVILASVFENVWYEGRYDSNNITPPSCFALGTPEEAGKDGSHLRPHPDVLNPPAETCAECPKFQWKSDPDGGKGKACSSKRRLALVPKAAATSVGAAQKAEMAVLRVPVTSIKFWSKYVNELAATASRPTWAVLTNVSLSPHAKNQFQVNFSYKSNVDDHEVLGVLKGLTTGAESQLLTPYDMTPPAEPQPEGKTKY